MRVLLIEDDAMIAESLLEALGDAKIETDWVRTGPEGEEALLAAAYALVLLDLNLPGKQGLDVLDAVRKEGDRTPILIISARDTVEDRLAGLDKGADDYLVKPFDTRELLSRIRALLRRRAGQAVSTIRAGDVVLDLSTHELRRGELSHALTKRESALMQCLMERPGMVWSRPRLEEHIYGIDQQVESNAVEVLIHAIRKRFGKDVIENVRGLGWRVRKASPA
ncbi:MAG: response regulator transcription factor [Hyphomicrobiales bacterium]